MNSTDQTEATFSAPEGFVLVNAADLSDIIYRVREGWGFDHLAHWKDDVLMRLEAAQNGY